MLSRYMNIIILPDGTELTSGNGQINNIRSTTLTECVNSGEELTMGSVCASMMEMTVQTPQGALFLAAGDEVTLFKEDRATIIESNAESEDESGAEEDMETEGETESVEYLRHQAGIFVLEKPTRASANILKLTGYDRVAKLNKDLTSWVKSLDSWPYTLQNFAAMVCEACGLELATESIPNGDYAVQRFEKEATGRQLMEWIGQICCRFCRATPDGKIELAWYTPSGVTIKPTGDRHYIGRGLSYEDYQVAPIEAVQVRLTDSEDGAPIPTVPDGTNSYIISGNPIFTTVTQTVLDNIQAELDKLPRYTPCRIALPAALDLRAGHTLDITDINGKTITALAMTKTQKGQRDTLECTGSPRRDSPTAINNRTAKDQAAGYERTALIAGKEAAKNLTPEEIFAALTDNGAIQGLYLQDGKVYINAEFVQIVNLVAQSIVSGRLSSTDGRAYFDLDGGFFAVDGKPDENGKITGVRIRDYMLYGLRQNEDGSDAVTTFELLSAAEEIRFTDGTLIPSGLPIRIWSNGGLHLGREGDKVTLMGKTLYWAPNSDGQTYTLMGM